MSEKFPVYVFNTETVETKRYRCKTYFFLAAGFKDILFLSSLDLTGINIIYYDINPDSIDLKKWEFEFWDGEKQTLYNKIKTKGYNYCLSDLGYVPKSEFPKLSMRDQFEHSWKIEVEKWGSNEEFKKAFFKIKNHSDKQFIILDISKDFEKLSNILNTSEEPIYFWYSNCFEFDHNKTTPEMKLQFLDIIKKSEKKIYINGS